jgi:hypothetical protein
MNKKLFSWKALAGLALLVAMGLTSCKQGTEVDPNDPYNTTKPAQPGTSTKGGDLVFTITKSSDLTSLWASYDATKKAELMKKTTLNIVINSGSYKLDGGVLTLPKFFNTTANSVLNLTFNGSFQDTDKNPLALDASSNLDGAKVNVVLPGQTFNMILDAAKVAASISSTGEAAIGSLKAIANTEKNNALTIASGVTVKAIDDASTGAILVNGGAINALIVNAAPTFVTKKGFKIGNQDTYTTNLIINTTGLTITNDKDTPLGDITINKNKNLTLGFAAAKINSITGTKASEGTLNVANGGALANIAIVKNVTVNSLDGSNFAVKSDIFDGVKLNGVADLTATTVNNVEFANNVNIKYNADNQTFAFTGCAFSGWVNVTGGIEKTTTPTKKTYQWDINNKKWVEVTAAAPISAANASDTGIEVSSNDVAVDNTGAITKGADKIGDHKVFTIVTPNNVTILPENCALTLDKCTYGGAAITDANINNAIAWGVAGVDPLWLSVTVDGTAYTWRKGTGWWVLVK